MIEEFLDTEHEYGESVLKIVVNWLRYPFVDPSDFALSDR
jgi:hypothetical protein